MLFISYTTARMQWLNRLTMNAIVGAVQLTSRHGRSHAVQLHGRRLSAWWRVTCIAICLSVCLSVSYTLVCDMNALRDSYVIACEDTRRTLACTQRNATNTQARTPRADVFKRRPSREWSRSFDRPPACRLSHATTSTCDLATSLASSLGAPLWRAVTRVVEYRRGFQQLNFADSLADSRENPNNPMPLRYVNRKLNR